MSAEFGELHDPRGIASADEWGSLHGYAHDAALAAAAASVDNPCELRTRRAQPKVRNEQGKPANLAHAAPPMATTQIE